MKQTIFTVLIAMSLLFIACGEDDKPTNPDDNGKTGTFADIDGNVYKTVKICDQVGLAKNLNVSSYRNGDAIHYAITVEEWNKAEENQDGAWCYYDNDPSNGEIYGKLYNWYAVNDPRGLAPAGWHIASLNEWYKLEECLGGYGVAGGKLKSTGTIQKGSGVWDSPNYGATNEIGFSALPGGYRSESDGSFETMASVGIWWTSSENRNGTAFYLSLYNANANLDRGFENYINGYSVRCVKD